GAGVDHLARPGHGHVLGPAPEAVVSSSIAHLHGQGLGGRIPGLEEVVQGPFDHVVHHVKLLGVLVAVLEPAGQVIQRGQGQQSRTGRHGKSELDVVTCVIPAPRHTVAGGRVASPGDRVVGGQLAGPLRVIEEDGLGQG
ncbi:hypothetical protein EGW08_012772, partial [Elysia chlorotica]